MSLREAGPPTGATEGMGGPLASSGRNQRCWLFLSAQAWPASAMMV